MPWLQLAILLMVYVTPVRAEPLDISTQAPIGGLAQWAEHLEDPASSLTIGDVVGRSFSPVSSKYIDFGFSSAVQWVKIPVRNSSDTTVQRLLSFNMRFMQALDAYLYTSRGIEPVISNHEDSPFSERDIQHRHLVASFSLGPQEEGAIYVRYWSAGTTALPISIETFLSMEQRSGGEYLRHAAFYAFIGVLILYSLLFGAMSREKLFAAYAFYVSTVALYLGHMDGYTFQFLWPDWPRWNAAAALPLGMGLNIGAAVFSLAFLQTRKRHRWLHRAILALAGFCVLYLLSGVVISQSVLKQFAFPITLLFSFFFLGCGIYSFSRGHRDVRFYVVGWFGMAFAASATTVIHFIDGEFPVSISFDIIRLGVLVDATMMGIAVVDRFNSQRRAHNAAQALANKALAERIEMQHRVMSLEERYNAANLMAEERGLQLAEASHDLRQPLAALRASIGPQSGEKPDIEDQEQIRQTIGYLEKLVDRYLVETSSAAAKTGTPRNHAGEGHRAGSEDVPLQVIFDNLKFMFESDASEKQVELRFVESSLWLHADPLAVVRILSNAVSNSIRYTPAGGKVLVGSRRLGREVAIQVMDNGPGIASEEVDGLMQPYAQADGNSSNGFGLGLSITRELVDANGVEWSMDSREHAGTVNSFLFTRVHNPASTASS